MKKPWTIAILNIFIFGNIVSAGRMGNFIGKLVDHDTGKPIPGAEVVLYYEQGTSNKTDSLGNYVFSGLRPGAYRIEYSAKDYVKSMREAVIIVEDTTIVNFHLSTKGKLVKVKPNSDQNGLHEEKFIVPEIEAKRLPPPPGNIGNLFITGNKWITGKVPSDSLAILSFHIPTMIKNEKPFGKGNIIIEFHWRKGPNLSEYDQSWFQFKNIEEWEKFKKLIDEVDSIYKATK